jgi:hypothetical protein
MSHPDPLFDPDNSYEDDDMIIEHDPSDILFAEYLYDNKEDIYMDDDTNYDDYNDFMDGDHDSAMNSIGWDVDEGYGYYGEDY